MSKSANVQVGFPLDVAFFTADKDGFMQRDDYTITAQYDVPLKETIAKIPPLLAYQLSPDGLVCKGDNFKGEEIDLEKKPVNIEYFFQTFYNRRTPILFVTVTKNGKRADSGISMSLSAVRRSSVSAEMLKSVLRRKASSSASSSNSDSDVRVGSIRQKVTFGDPKHITIDSTTGTGFKTSLDDDPKRITIDSTGTGFSTSLDDDVFTQQQTVQHPALKKSACTLQHRKAPLWSYTEMEETRRRDPPQSATMRTPTNIVRNITSPQLTKSPAALRPRENALSRKSKSKAFRRKRASTLDLNLHQITLKVTVDNGHSVEIPCHSHITIGELKNLISHELSSAGKLPKTTGLCLTYSLEGKTYELFNDSQLLINTAFFFAADVSESSVMTGLMCGGVCPPVRRDLVTLYRITQLSRVILDDRVTELGDVNLQEYTAIAAPDKKEMDAARRTLHDYVLKVTSERSTEDYVLSVDIARDTAPTTLILMVPYNNQIPVTFHYKTAFALTKQISIYQTADAILKVIHHCLVECDLIKSGVEGYTMQVSGVNTFIHGNHELIAFTEVRRCITKKEPIHLSVLMKPSCLLYQPFDISWLPLDPLSYTPPSQVDVSEAYRRETRSLWECPETECFKLRLVRAENLPFRSTNMLMAEFSLHFGSHMLHGVRTTEEKVQDSFIMTWKEDIDFITPLRDIPKAAKVLVVIRNTNSNTYYWGMINIFDHQSKLRSGDHVINLWEVKMESTQKGNRRKSFIHTPVVEKETEAFSSVLSGPAADNPSPNAVRVVISFRNQALPTYCPSIVKKSWKKLFEQHPGFRNYNRKKHFKVYSSLKFNMRSNKKPYHNLPLHIENIDWGSLSERLEVYNVLDTIENMEEVDDKGKMVKEVEKIPLYVAFRLLDKDFPDETVRAFAVKIIEHHVKSDTLEDYLLQLTQALKFEHDHDSALARYLLKQAVTNRHIGHLFFWYLRGEMQNPQYMLRFAVILEAYLKGCGEALLVKYMDHVTMQDSLEVIGQRLKDNFGKDSARMQQALPRELEKSELQKMTIVPAFNSRARLGGLRTSHCKVMNSAKKPMFLEMLNVSSTALRADPVRLIMKMGDDLRQDMITLRMLSLFEKMWENEGLDLKLIPYGCMATGPRTGFIEVVKNSKTIAEVSGVRENRKLYEWIKQHQKDEFGEVDPEKLKTAIDTFVHSCAGYSVATYILGIGDRHNDNIMITTSGNLFHIDFGHFLGNIKHFMTFKREWSPFVLTPDFTYVMGGEDSETFQFYKHLCIRAFLILRRHADLIINLFSMMRSTGIPELTCVEDTDYIKTALAVEMTDTEAEKEFQTIIKKCLDVRWTVQVMWAIHKLRNQSPKKK